MRKCNCTWTIDKPHHTPECALAKLGLVEASTPDGANVCTFNIPLENLSGLIKDLNKLTKRAEKLKLDNPLEWSRGESFIVEKLVYPPSADPSIAVPRKKLIEYAPITIILRSEIKLPGGWHLVGVLDHKSADLPIIRAVPGEELPVHFRDSGPDCNHCKLDRRRNTTIVIRDEQPAAHADHYKQIGSTCIADYLGHKDALSIAQAYQYIAEFIGGLRDEDECGYYRHAPSIWELNDCLSFTAALVRNDGWSPRSGGGYSTASEAWNWFLGDFQPITVTGRYDKKEKIYPPTVEDKDRELAAKALEWLNVQDPRKAKSDYIYNIQAIAHGENPRVTSKTIGLAASIVGTYKRVIERELRYKHERKEKNNGYESKHVGEIKKRIRGLEIEVFGAYETAGDYGTYTRVVFKDAEGNDFVWFASGYSELEAGHKYKVDATVKKHNLFKGAKQTQVNRVTVKLGLLDFDRK